MDGKTVKESKIHVSIHITRPTNALTKDVFIPIARSPTCFDCCRGHHQDYFQEG